MLKKFNLSTSINIFFSLSQGKKYICFDFNSYLFYLKIPKNITLKKNKENLIMYSPENFNLFSSLVFNYLKRIKKPFKKRLILKGLGFKVNFINKASIQLKLGFSHSVNIAIPTGLILSSVKNFITISGLNKSIVGGLANLIKKKRIPDIYKGKGIYYKNEKILLKAVKKS